MGAAVAADRRAIKTMGASLGKDRPLVATFGLLAHKRRQLATEDEPYDLKAPPYAIGRATTEDTLKDLASRGIRTSVVRLPPIVHGPRAFGLASLVIPGAKKTKEAVYPGDGMGKWPAVNHLDAARLFRLALEKGPAGGIYHGVDEEAIPFKEIVEVIGRRLSVPVVSKPSAEAAKRYGFIGSLLIAIDNPASSKLTQERLGWTPTQTGLLAALKQSDVFDL